MASTATEQLQFLYGSTMQSVFLWISWRSLFMDSQLHATELSSVLLIGSFAQIKMLLWQFASEQWLATLFTNIYE